VHYVKQPREVVSPIVMGRTWKCLMFDSWFMYATKLNALPYSKSVISPSRDFL